jgi:hypothetical protein
MVWRRSLAASLQRLKAGAAVTQSINVENNVINQSKMEKGNENQWPYYRCGRLSAGNHPKESQSASESIFCRRGAKGVRIGRLHLSYKVASAAMLHACESAAESCWK